MSGTYRYVSIHELPAYEAAGWFDLGPLPGHHAGYSHLMYLADETQTVNLGKPDPIPEQDISNDEQN